MKIIRPMTPLRRRMLEDIQIRHYSPHTIDSYLRYVAQFAKHFKTSPDRLGAEHIRAYQLHFLKKEASKGIFIQSVCALRFLYETTLHRLWMVEYIPYPKKPLKLRRVPPRKRRRLPPCGGRLGGRKLMYAGPVSKPEFKPVSGKSKGQGFSHKRERGDTPLSCNPLCLVSRPWLIKARLVQSRVLSSFYPCRYSRHPVLTRDRSTLV